MVCDTHQTLPREGKLNKILLPVKIVKPPPLPALLPLQPPPPTSRYHGIFDTAIQRYRMWEFKFHYLHIRCKKVETIVLTMCAERLVITRTGEWRNREIFQSVRSEVENISPRRKIISTPNTRPVNICRRNCVTV